jgi:hypothetical protein
MRISLKILLVLPIVIIFGMVNVSAYAGALDGKSFVGSSGLMGQEASGKDEVRFENGQFISLGCKEWGFGYGPYLTSVEGDKTHFVADTYSDKEGRITWIGTISGNNADVTYLWHKKGAYAKPEQIKWFKGSSK